MYNKPAEGIANLLYCKISPLLASLSPIMILHQTSVKLLNECKITGSLKEVLKSNVSLGPAKSRQL